MFVGGKIAQNTRSTYERSLPMTNNELELINIIRKHENPEQALLTAVLIIGSVLEQPLTHQEPLADSRQVHA